MCVAHEFQDVLRNSLEDALTPRFDLHTTTIAPPYVIGSERVPCLRTLATDLRMRPVASVNKLVGAQLNQSGIQSLHILIMFNSSGDHWYDGLQTHQFGDPVGFEGVFRSSKPFSTTAITPSSLHLHSNTGG